MTDSVLLPHILVDVHGAIQEFKGDILSYQVIPNYKRRLVLVLSQPGAFCNDKVTIASQIAELLVRYYGFSACSSNHHSVIFRDALGYPHEVRFVNPVKWREIADRAAEPSPSAPITGTPMEHVVKFLGHVAYGYPQKKKIS